MLNSFIILLFSDTELVFGTDINWFAYSFISMAGFAAIALIVKQLTRLDINPDVINFYIFLFTTAGFYPFIYFSDLSFSVPPKSLLFFLLFMLVAVITNHCSVIALKTAPNPGYVLAVRSFNSVLVSVVAIFLFKSEISVRKFIGIIFSVVGLILLAL